MVLVEDVGVHMHALCSQKSPCPFLAYGLSAHLTDGCALEQVDMFHLVDPGHLTVCMPLLEIPEEG